MKTISFRPANGTEGDIFMNEYCDQCVHDNYPNTPYCQIISDSMTYYIGNAEYPKELIKDNNGWGICTKFKKENEI